MVKNRYKQAFTRGFTHVCADIVKSIMSKLTIAPSDFTKTAATGAL